MNLLVTGGAGFIGSHLVDALLARGDTVTVVDNLDPFYSPKIKQVNVASHQQNCRYSLLEADIRDSEGLRRHLSGEYDAIVHLAARAGVRPSILDPVGYQDVNIRGTQNLLELAKEWGISRFIFASSSSVYGVNPNVPWSEEDHVLRPISPYASTKVSGELLGHVYSHLYGMHFTALRFFTVYGPRQRPDLAIHKFARMMLRGEAIPVFGNGSTRRDYTYVEDIVQGILGAIGYTGSPFEVVNLGNNRTVSLVEVISTLEATLGIEARIERLPEQPGDVPQTWADINKAGELWGYLPATTFQMGIAKFAEWVGKGSPHSAANASSAF